MTVFSIDTHDTPIEKLNDTSYWLGMLVDRFADSKDVLAKAQQLDHHEYLLEFGQLSDVDCLQWSAHRTGTFGRELVFARDGMDVLTPTTLTTRRRLVRLSREKSGVNQWTITTLEGYDHDGREIGIVDLAARYMEHHHAQDMEWRAKNPDSTLPGKISQMVFSLQHYADELGVKPGFLTWQQGIELLHRLQRQYGMWEHMKENRILFSFLGATSRVVYDGAN